MMGPVFRVLLRPRSLWRKQIDTIRWKTDAMDAEIGELTGRIHLLELELAAMRKEQEK